MTVTTEYGKQNVFATEPPIELMNNEPNFEQAERLNGLLAMMGFVAGLGAYATTGQLIPGIF